MIAPPFSSGPALSFFALGLEDVSFHSIRCVVGSTDATFVGSTTRTGKPFTVDPLGCQAYTWRSMSAAITSSGPPCRPLRFASTGEPTNPCWVRLRLWWETPRRTLTKGESGLPE